MKIERAAACDAARIAEMEKEYIECAWSEETLRGCFECERYDFFKAVDGGEIIGYIGMERCLDEGNICNVAVEKSYRRRGVAFALMSDLISHAKEIGITKLFLEVNENNRAAIALYEKLGFVTLSVRLKYYGKDGALNMVKTLI